ncbi:MAG TPA: polysaccharide biosynthesis tyrosine autokinase [Terriglobales bacterium]|nr:polysaccharide biosynthesis tyrosine autokinase [Terriglobales bacterium]
MDPSNLLRTEASRSLDVLRPATANPEAELATLEPSLLEYWRLLLKRKWTIVSCVVVITVLVAIQSFRATKLYDAVGRIAINHQNSDALGFRQPGEGSDDDYDYTINLDTQAKILESNAVALQVIKNLHLDQDPRFTGRPTKVVSSAIPVGSAGLTAAQEDGLLGAFHGGLSVKAIPRTRILELHFLSSNPNLSAQIVNELANVYIEQNFKAKFESTVRTSEWLSKQLSDLQLKVETSQQRLVDYQKEHGIVGVDEKQNIITTKLDQLNKELTDSEMDRIQKESLYRMSLEGKPELLPKLSTSSGDSALVRLRDQENSLRSQLSALTTQFGPNYPKVKEISTQLQSVQAAINTELANAAEQYRTAYLAAQEREKLLRASFEGQKQEANQLNESAIQYSLLRRDYESNKQLYDGLLQRLKEAGVSAGLRSSNVQIIDQARVPTGPSQPNIPRNITSGLFLSLAGGIGLAFLLEMLDNSVRSPDQVELIAGLPTLGMIPSGLRLNTSYGRALKPLRAGSQVLPQQESVETISYLRPQSQSAEAYRTLRTSILLSSWGAPPKVLLVTSPMAQEGKTTTSINTAIVLAQRGARVLLVDADLRRPSIHKAFGIIQRPGLAEYLTGNIAEAPIVSWSQLPNLHLLTSGGTPPHPAELLGSGLMNDALAEWRKKFDHIVIDTPPALSVTDSVLLSVQADSVILVIRSGHTTKQGLRRARQLLSYVNAKITGVVVNAMDLNASDYYYYYGYYGKKYGYYYKSDKVEEQPRQ